METKALTVLQNSKKTDIDPGYFSIPREVTYPTTDNKVSHGYFYPPKVIYIKLSSYFLTGSLGCLRIIFFLHQYPTL